MPARSAETISVLITVACPAACARWTFRLALSAATARSHSACADSDASISTPASAHHWSVCGRTPAPDVEATYRRALTVAFAFYPGVVGLDLAAP